MEQSGWDFGWGMGTFWGFWAGDLDFKRRGAETQRLDFDFLILVFGFAAGGWGWVSGRFVLSGLCDIGRNAFVCGLFRCFGGWLRKGVADAHSAFTTALVETPLCRRGAFVRPITETGGRLGESFSLMG